MTNFIAPAWTVLTVLAAIIYGTYFVAAFYIKGTNTDTEHEIRISTLEIEFKGISRKQDQILFILSRLEKDHHDEVVN